MRLAHYLRKANEGEAAFARRVEAPRSAVHKWLLGTLPSPRYMRAIYRETDGAVTPNDFYGLRRRARREQEINWRALESQFQALDDARERGELTAEEHRAAVQDLDREMRVELELELDDAPVEGEENG